MRICLYLLFPAFILGSCASSDISYPKEFKGDQVIVSYGGGFTGQWTTWYILSDGRLFKQEGLSGTPVYSRTLSRSDTKKCLELVRELELENKPFSHPGNITYSLSWKHEGIASTVKWGDPDAVTPGEFRSAYSGLMSIIGL